jgi:hypothetical protein
VNCNAFFGATPRATGSPGESSRSVFGIESPLGYLASTSDEMLERAESLRKQIQHFRL